MIIFFSVLILVPLLCYLLLLSTWVQTTLAQYACGKLSEKLKTKVSIGKLDIGFFDHVELDQVFVADLSQDTLFSVEKLRVDIKDILYKKRQLVVSCIELNGLNYELRMDSLSMNLDFLIKAFSSSDTTPPPPTKPGKPWTIKVNSLKIADSKFTMKNSPSIPPKWGMDYFDMKIDSLQIKMKDIVIDDKINLNLVEFGLRDKSGLRLKQFSSHIELTDHLISLDNAQLALPRSTIDAKHIGLGFKKWEAFTNYVQEVEMEAVINPSSYINIDDISYFTETLKGFDLKVGIEGYAKGTVSDMIGKDLKLNFGNHTYLTLDFSMKGLIDVDKTVFQAKIRDMRTCRSDIEMIPMYPFDSKQKINLPSFINPSEPLDISCDFKGLLTDFKCSADLKSKIGNVITTFEYTPNYDDPKASDFIAYVSTDNFALSKVAGTNLLNRVSFEAYLDGTTDKDSTSAQLKGVVKSLDFNQYEYTNIRLDGTFDDKILDFSAQIDEKNIDLKLGGKIYTAPKIPEYEVYVDCKEIKLGRLNLDTSAVDAHASFKLTSNFAGTDPDSIKGRVQIDQFKYGRKGREMSINKIVLSAKDSVNFKKNIHLNSDVANAHIYGNFGYTNIAEALINSISSHLPSLDSLLGRTNFEKPQDLHFKLDLIRPSIVLNVLSPDISISPKSSIKGDYNNVAGVFNIESDTLNVRTGGTQFNKVKFDAKRINNDFNIKAFVKNINFGQGKIDSVSLALNAHNDTIISSLIWDNNRLRDNFSGEISSSVVLAKNGHKLLPSVKTTIYPSIFTISDTTWSIKESEIFLDTTSVTLKHFKIFNSLEEYLQLEGKVSESPADTLNLKLSNIKLTRFKYFLPKSGFDLSGLLFGKTSVSNLYDKPMIVSNDSILNLKLNEKMLGDFYLKSKFDPSGDKLDVNSYLMDKLTKNVKDTTKTFSLNGSIYPKSSLMDFKSNINYLDLTFLNPLLKDYVSNIVGLVSSDTIKISGSTNAPKYQGNFTFSKFACQYDYLKTYFNTDGGSVFLSNEIIRFDSLRLNGDNRRALLLGDITHNNFDNMTFGLNLQAEDFCFLNTQEKDNNLYYGRANASGSVYITGGLDKIKIDVNAKTEKDTKLSIPIFSGSDVATNNFLTFKRPKAELDSLASLTENNNDYKVDLSKLEMNLNLDVTPDAEVQIIMNEKTGDMIKAKGKGNINLSIDTKGKFEMQGNYIISKGEYQFSLQNIINKKFSIQDGSTINWTGDPTGAKIDISALYHLKKVSLYDLVLEDDYKEERVPIDCKLHMTNELLNPNIKFGIVLPEKEERISSQVNNLASDDLSKEFLSLLVINRFQPLPGLRGQVENKAANFGLSSNASELLSNQLSNWLSQINNDVDIGVNYRANDSINKSQVELALSTQIFNERIKLNGNVNMKMQDQTTNNLVGEFDIEGKITKNLSAKYYNRLNDNNHYEVTPYRQGLGVFYQKDFNQFKELFKRENKEEIIKRRKTKKEDKQTSTKKAKN